MHRILWGDNQYILPRLPVPSDYSVISSPPYAEQRKGLYDSIASKDYPKYTAAWMDAVHPALQPGGSVLLILGARIVADRYDEYIARTILHLIDHHGWRRPARLTWHKPGSFPTGSPDRPRREHEEILWFTRGKTRAYCDPFANGSLRLSHYGELCGGFTGNGKGLRHALGEAPLTADDLHQRRGKRTRDEQPVMARSTDVLRASPGAIVKPPGNTHPAEHPVELYRQLVRMFVPPGGTVIDPFAGSGTLMEAAYLEGRHSLSMDVKREYVEVARRRLASLDSEREKITL
jgi:site-specific DNA-methyltransferase (adenine-specific)